MISPFSVIGAVFFYTIVLYVICRLYEETAVVTTGGWSVLWFSSIIAAVKLIAPIEIPVIFAIRLPKPLGFPQRLLNIFPIIGYLLITAWFAGAVKYAVRDLRLLRRVKEECSQYTVFENEHVTEIARKCGVKCRVVLTKNVESARVIGIFRRTVYLPDSEVEDWEMEMILKHEAQHIRSHDAFWKLFLGLLSEAVWWTQLTQTFQEAVDRLLEFRCDENVTKHMAENEKTKYLRALANAASRVVSKQKPVALGMNEFFAVDEKDVLKARKKK